MRLLGELSNLNTQFLSLSLQITDQLLNPSQFRFEGASGCRSVPAHVPRVSSRRLKLLSKHDQVLFQSRVLGHRLLEFLKEREKRGKIIPRSWHVIVVIVVVVVRQAKVDDTSKTEIYLFLCFSFIYLEEYRLYLETMNGTIKSNFFLRTISLLFIYIYILFREENPDYFSLWKKFFILFEEWNERKVLDWIRVSLNSSDGKYARNRFNFYPTPLARRLKFLGREFFSHKTRLYFNRPIKNDSDSSYLRVVRQQHPHSAQLFFQQKLLLPVSLRLRQIAPASLQFVPEAA